MTFGSIVIRSNSFMTISFKGLVTVSSPSNVLNTQIPGKVPWAKRLRLPEGCLAFLGEFARLFFSDGFGLTRAARPEAGAVSVRVYASG